MSKKREKMERLKKLAGLAALVATLWSCGGEEPLFRALHKPPEKEPPVINPVGEPDEEPVEQQPASPEEEYLPPPLQCRRENCSMNYIIEGVQGRVTQEIIQVVQMQERWYTLRLVCSGACYANQPPPTSPVPYGPDSWANQQCYLVNDYTASRFAEENPEMVHWFFDSEPAVYVPLNDCLPLPDNVQFMLLYADIPYFDGNAIPAYEGEIEFCLIPHGDAVSED